MNMNKYLISNKLSNPKRGWVVVGHKNITEDHEGGSGGNKKIVDYAHLKRCKTVLIRLFLLRLS